MAFQVLSPQVVQEMLDHHGQIVSHPSIKRGKSLEAFSYGKMVAVGARVPQGGRPGDTYTTFGHQVADDVEDLKMLFNHAKVSLMRFPADL